MKTLKPSEIAEYCDVHQRTVSRWIASGQLKGHKLPGRGNYRVLVDDFLDFLHRQNIPATDSLNNFGVKPSVSKLKQVLVIEDEAGIRNAVRRVLQSEGFEVLTAENGFEAGVKVTSEHVDLIVLDLNMPGIDGFDVIQFIRSKEEFCNIKILVLSGMSPSFLDRAVSFGADCAIAKPFENDVLLANVRNLLF